MTVIKMTDFSFRIKENCESCLQRNIVSDFNEVTGIPINLVIVYHELVLFILIQRLKREAIVVILMGGEVNRQS